jgi:hypothetical protein
MLPNISASGIDLAKSVLSFATALITFLALFKKNVIFAGLRAFSKKS